MSTMTVEQFDKQVNEGMDKLDRMRRNGEQKSPEYTKLLYKLRDLTRERLKAAGLSIETLK